MSEYQYYEWQALDRPLTDAEQSKVDRLSSHIHVTSTYAQVDYSWGDFKHDEKKVLAQYFDAFLYMSNWGSKQLMFRLPKALLDAEQITPYCVDYHVALEPVGDHYILDFNLTDEEPGEWIEGEGWLSSLAQLRNDILQGDYRVLYLAWLRATELDYDLDEAAVEPPVPPGLQTQTPGLDTFMRFFEIDALLVKAAAKASTTMSSQPDAAEWRRAIATLSRDECDEILLRLIEGTPRLTLELKRRLQPQLGKPASLSASTGRTVGDIHAERDALLREQHQQRQAAAEVRRLKELDALALRKEATWQEVERLIETSQAKAYDGAVALLVKLSDLANHEGEVVAFEGRITDLRGRYHRRRSLLERLQKAGL